MGGTAAAGVFVTMAPTMLGMSLNQISSLLDQGLIDRHDALEIAPNREALVMALKGIGVS